ncbi:hypothetical protein nvc1_099 [Namao virus]|nr:hypothetical protein nvc1_099 [Namao virus]
MDKKAIKTILACCMLYIFYPYSSFIVLAHAINNYYKRNNFFIFSKYRAVKATGCALLDANVYFIYTYNKTKKYLKNKYYNGKYRVIEWMYYDARSKPKYFILNDDLIHRFDPNLWLFNVIYYTGRLYFLKNFGTLIADYFSKLPCSPKCTIDEIYLYFVSISTSNNKTSFRRQYHLALVTDTGNKFYHNLLTDIEDYITKNKEYFENKIESFLQTYPMFLTTYVDHFDQTCYVIEFDDDRASYMKTAVREILSDMAHMSERIDKLIRPVVKDPFISVYYNSAISYMIASHADETTRDPEILAQFCQGLERCVLSTNIPTLISQLQKVQIQMHKNVDELTSYLTGIMGLIVYFISCINNIICGKIDLKECDIRIFKETCLTILNYSNDDKEQMPLLEYLYTWFYQEIQKINNNDSTSVLIKEVLKNIVYHDFKL